MGNRIDPKIAPILIENSWTYCGYTMFIADNVHGKLGKYHENIIFISKFKGH